MIFDADAIKLYFASSALSDSSKGVYLSRFLKLIAAARFFKTQANGSELASDFLSLPDEYLSRNEELV